MTKKSTAPPPIQRPADAGNAGRSLREWTSEGRPSRAMMIAGVVSDGRIPLPCKEEGSTEQVKYPSIVGGTADF